MIANHFDQIEPPLIQGIKTGCFAVALCDVVSNGAALHEVEICCPILIGLPAGPGTRSESA